MERVFATGREPIGAINELLQNVTQFLKAAVNSGFTEIQCAVPREEIAETKGLKPLEQVTGEHYGQLFKSFSSASFWEEPVHLLALRLEKNGIKTSQIQDKEVLDAGCGGGRYSVAWRLLGAGCVTGVDVSEVGIANAQHRVSDSGIDHVTFRTGNVLELPFAANTFDVVFSNGVLHHTLSWRKGMAELMRVLKPGGWGWLYLIENPGGLFWDVIEILRVILKDEPREKARAALEMLGVPANRSFYMLDHVMVPINVRLTSFEIEECLTASGAKDITRLNRGADFDRVERIYQQEPFASAKYGIGENRYVFSKS
jgi:ubiquinone/menaquinone biosynthesis C-methylase UbiE